MHSKTSSTALTTRHSVRTFTRPRITTAFTPSAAAHSLVAAIYAWGRIAAPVPNPGPCPVAWCVGCMWSGDDEDARLHQSATATVEASAQNGEPARHQGDTISHTARVTVERADGGQVGDEPAIVHVYLGQAEGPDLSPAKAREVVAALRKAAASAAELPFRGGVKNGTTGAISIVRLGDRYRSYQLQIGAVVEHGAGYVFINYVPVDTAAQMRDRARKGFRRLDVPETWDFQPAGAGRLADAVDAATALVEADRAAQAVTR